MAENKEEVKKVEVKEKAAKKEKVVAEKKKSSSKEKIKKEQPKKEKVLKSNKKEEKLTNVKLYNKWSFDVVVNDISLKEYINLKPIIIPRTNGYYHNTAFYKTKINIVERLMNRLQVCGHKGKKHYISSGHNTGKALTNNRIIYEAFEKIEKATKKNPIEVLVRAIENAAPREEIITIERSGARYAQAVDISPLRRVNLVLRFLGQGAAQKAFNNSKSLVDALVDEILDCYEEGGNSLAMSKKLEIEKMAAAAK